MKVRIKLLEEALGSSPSNEDLMGTYIASKAPTADLTSEEIDNIKAQNAEDRITVFPKQADGTPFIYDYQIKGMLKDSCKALAAAGKAGYPGGKACAGLKAYKKAIDGLIFCVPPRDSLRPPRPQDGLLRTPAPGQHPAGRTRQHRQERERTCRVNGRV